MCHQRLEVGEAPACVQACPTEAIRIIAVNPSEAASDGFLNGAPDPAMTRPTTRFVGRPVPASAFDADRERLHPQPAHRPLVLMLVLSQLGAGFFTAGLFAASRPLALTACAVFLLGLLASVLHLGRPMGAWRFFLGLRRSWLSREILAFGLTAGAMIGAALFAPHLPRAVLLSLGAVGWAALFASVMVYVDTGKPSWSFPRTAARFFGTALLAALFGFVVIDLLPALLFTAALALKLAVEAANLLPAYDRAWSPRRHTARLQLHPLRRVLQARMVLGAGAALFTPLWLPGACLLFVAGELAERLLFFRSVAAVRMPGAVPIG
jgi:DMSO reductase anchor subunit